MNRFSRWVVTVLLLTCSLNALAQPPELARPRLWTSASGVQLMALFVELSGDQVILQNRQGDRINISRDKLSDKDQAFLNEVLGLAPAPEVVPETPEPHPDITVNASQNPLLIEGTEALRGEKMIFRTPLSDAARKTLRNAQNEASEAVVGLWLPADFDPNKAWNILLVSGTANASSVDHMFFYLDAARDAGGWIVVAADGPHAPPNSDSTAWRWEMAQAALLSLDVAWPGARQWPIATGGYSGGAKRSGLLGAILCKEKWNLIGMYMGGCNQDMATTGLNNYTPSRSEFRKTPIYLSAGNKDEVAPVEKAEKVQRSMESTGFRTVRLETYDGGHDPFIPHITESLKWFTENAPTRR